LLAAGPIDRLVNVPLEDYIDALSILFVSYFRFPRMSIQFSNERAILIEIFNQSNEALRTIKSESTQFRQHLFQLKEKSQNPISDKLTNSFDHEQQPMLLDPSFKHGIIAIMLNNILEKYEQQQSISCICKDVLNLLSDPNLKLIKPAEQVSVCYKCLNFEHISGTYPYRDPICSKCQQDCFTTRVYVLDGAYESHKRHNKDLPLFICTLINRELITTKQKVRAITSKKLKDFNIPDLDGDIDVWVEKTLTGIECKLRSSESKPIDFGSYSKGILDDLRKYIQAGVKHLIVVTNLAKDDASKLRDLLMASIDTKYDSLKVVHNSVRDLIQMALNVAEEVKRELNKSVSNKIIYTSDGKPVCSLSHIVGIRVSHSGFCWH
jgi:hypothetical protein